MLFMCVLVPKCSVHPYPCMCMQEFAGEGLRTLALAYKDLDEEYFRQWKQRHYEVSISLDNREDRLDLLYEEIEKDLLVGTTSKDEFYVYMNRHEQMY